MKVRFNISRAVLKRAHIMTFSPRLLAIARLGVSHDPALHLERLLRELRGGHQLGITCWVSDDWEPWLIVGLICVDYHFEVAVYASFDCLLSFSCFQFRA